MIARSLCAALLALLPAMPAWACSYVERPLDARFATAEVVFVGVVTATAGEHAALIEVHEVYKGEVDRVVRVIGTRSSDRGCSLTFVPGERYTIFGSIRSGSVATDESRAILGDGAVSSIRAPTARYPAGAASAVDPTPRTGPIAAASLLIALAGGGHVARRRTKWRPQHAM